MKTRQTYSDIGMVSGRASTFSGIGYKTRGCMKYGFLDLRVDRFFAHSSAQRCGGDGCCGCCGYCAVAAAVKVAAAARS